MVLLHELNKARSAFPLIRLGAIPGFMMTRLPNVCAASGKQIRKKTAGEIRAYAGIVTSNILALECGGIKELICMHKQRMLGNQWCRDYCANVACRKLPFG